MEARGAIALIDPAYNFQTLYAGIYPHGSTFGFEFVPAHDIDITALGFFDRGLDGLNYAHDVGVWTDQGEPIVSATVPQGMTAVAAGQYRYVPVAPTRLEGGKHYIIGATNPLTTTNHAPGPDLFPNLEGNVDLDALQIHPDITLGAANRYAVDDGLGNISLQFPEIYKPPFVPRSCPPLDPDDPLSGPDLDSCQEGDPLDYYYLGANFQFVPEPASLSLLAAAALLARHRRTH